MICRNLVYIEATQEHRGKHNIVWFGSWGLIPPSFEENTFYNFENDNFYLLVSEPADWETNYKKYYTIEVFPNTYKQWKENTYYDKSGDDYILLNEEPANWLTNYTDYYFISFVKKVLGNSKKEDNYAEKQKGVQCSLIQRLSVIKGELWYKASYGLPLTEKIKNKGIYDSIIINIIVSHPDVVNLTQFESVIENHKYHLNFTVYTSYDEELHISYII